MIKSLKSFASDDQGLETVEYAIIAGLIVTGLIAIIVAIGVWVKGSFNALKTDLGA
jgi:Flp pilus assembly pilin Flp